MKKGDRSQVEGTLLEGWESRERNERAREKKGGKKKRDSEGLAKNETEEEHKLQERRGKRRR